MESFKKSVAEMVGTCFLVLFGCGTACLVGTSGIGYLLSALAFGLTLLGLCYCIGNVSGCHVNPAVSLGMLLLRRMSLLDCVGYIASQFLGALAGSALLKLIFSQSGMIDRTGNLGANSTAGTGGSVWVAILVETLLTFLFVLVVIGVNSKEDYKPTAGIAAGVGLAVVHIFGIGFTGTSVNPARSLAPALFARGTILSEYWIFLVAPVIGAILAALLYTFFERKEKRKIKA